jgi:hypothetical protein
MTMLALGLAWSPADAQIPSALKKKAAKAAGVSTTAPLQPPKYNSELLELTEPRLVDLIAAKKATKEALLAPDGPKAIRKKLDEVTERRDAIYAKQVDQINEWDGKRMEFERCVGDKLAERTDQTDQEFSNRMMSDRALQQKLAELVAAMQQAQQQGDDAKYQKVKAEIDALRKPSRADTLAAQKACGMPDVPPAVAQYLELLQQSEELGRQLSSAERRVEKAEDERSKMTSRQRAIACERIKAWEAAMAEGKAAVEYSAEEIAALEKLARELKGKCD